MGYNRLNPNLHILYILREKNRQREREREKEREREGERESREHIVHQTCMHTDNSSNQNSTTLCYICRFTAYL